MQIAATKTIDLDWKLVEIDAGRQSNSPHEGFGRGVIAQNFERIRAHHHCDHVTGEHVACRANSIERWLGKDKREQTMWNGRIFIICLINHGFLQCLRQGWRPFQDEHVHRRFEQRLNDSEQKHLSI